MVPVLGASEVRAPQVLFVVGYAQAISVIPAVYGYLLNPSFFSALEPSTNLLN